MYGMALAVLSIALLVVTSSGAASQRPWIEQISWRPRAYLYHNFLSEAEADHVVTLAKPHITRSSVLNDDDSVSDAHEVRTSYGTFLRYLKTWRMGHMPGTKVHHGSVVRACSSG